MLKKSSILCPTIEEPPCIGSFQILPKSPISNPFYAHFYPKFQTYCLHIKILCNFSFQTTYGLIVVTLATLDMQIMKRQYSYQLICFYVLGFLFQLAAALLWVVDNLACDKLDKTRQSLNSYLSPFTQLHGWWHLLAGYATYMHIIFCISHRQLYLKKPCKLQPHFLFGYTLKMVDK